MIDVATLDDCFNYLSERGLELRCGAEGRNRWWAKLLSWDGTRCEVGESASLLGAIKLAIEEWEVTHE